jgi:hypothetical protein
MSSTGRDEQHRARRGQADRVAQWQRWPCAAQQLRGPVLHALEAALGPAVPAARQPAVVSELHPGGALRDDRADPGVRARRGDGLLTAHGQAHRADPAAGDVWSALQVAQGCGDVEVAVPAPVHRMATAPAMSPGIKQQHAVAVPGKHNGVRQDP